MGAGFAPLVFLYARGKKTSEGLAIAMTLVGIFVAVLWKQLGWNDYIYNVFPGIVAGFLTYLIGKRNEKA